MHFFPERRHHKCLSINFGKFFAKAIGPFTVAQNFLGNQGKQMRGKAKREPE